MSKKRKALPNSLGSKNQMVRCNTSAMISSSFWCGWQNLPHLMISDIMTMLGLESLDDLHKCRQVCRSWNMMIYQMTKHKKDKIRREADSRADKIRKDWLMGGFTTGYVPLLPEILTAASLAHSELLVSIEAMTLNKVDLGPVPTKHLAALASCVTTEVTVWGAKNFNIISILDNIECEIFGIWCQTLSSEETRALVRAMETRVERVVLWNSIFLDITELTQYSGQGKCRELENIDPNFGMRNERELKSWVKRMNWTGLGKYLWLIQRFGEQNSHGYLDFIFANSNLI